jgi:tetratricopeptide (TPR) repeat protein
MPIHRARVGLAIAAIAVLTLACASAGPVPAAQEWYELGNAWLEKAEWKRAGEAYSRALALDPSFAGASYNLARALAEAGDFEESIKVLDSLAKRDPGNVRVIAARAYALHKKGDDAAALATYQEALALDPYAPDAVYNAALLELAAGDAATAASGLDRLVAAKPEDSQALLLLGKARDKLAETDSSGASAQAALAAYEKAKALGKADAPALGRLGALYEGARRYTDAMDALEAALKADPKRAADWFALARLRLAVALDPDKGLEALKSALDAGFDGKEAAASLLDEPNLPEREKVQELLKAKGLAE